MFEKVLVALDFSVYSQKILDHVCFFVPLNSFKLPSVIYDQQNV